MRIRPLYCLALALAILTLSSSSLLAAEQKGSITILQGGVDEKSLGSWTLIRPGNNKLALTRKPEYSTEDAVVGRYTLLIEQPTGTSTEVNVYRNGELESTGTKPQAAFELANGEDVMIQVLYTLTRKGTVSITSQPAGIEFTMLGPNDWEVEGTTPESWTDAPEGLYSVTYHAIEGCIEEKKQSDRLKENSRVEFSIKLSCEGLDDLQPDYDKKLKYVTVLIGGKNVVFDDVPIDAWFAPFVFTVVKTGVASGYKDASGNPTGKYGPGDLVNMAQLAKGAHEVAGIDEQDARGTPSNTRARGTWFESYFLSAEQNHWQAFKDARMDPARPATRGEVIATLLQAMDVPRFWPKGDTFRDVDPDTPYAASIETAAADGLITGFTDANGNPTGKFGPNEPVNRAEASKIIAKAIELYIENSAEIQPDALD